MPTAVDSRLTSEVNDDSSEDLFKFIMHLVQHSQYKSIRVFTTGSSVEIPSHCKMIAEEFGVKVGMLDYDEMSYSAAQYAFPYSHRVPDIYSGTIVRVCTEDVHAGYVRLIWERNNTEVELKALINQSERTMHGPAVLYNQQNVAIHYPKYAHVINRGSSIRMEVSHDVVYAVHSPYWPVEAIEWITRRRPHGFPSKSVIKKIVRYGCDFVQVSHNRLCNNNEWRFSFSKAELLIIKSWTTPQMIVYTTLWVLNKRIASSSLCSYYFKTLMFWACEEKPAQFWSDNFLVNCVCELLMEMMKWVEFKFCANYFIPGNNIMDHLFDTDLSHDINDMWKALESVQLITEVIDTCWRYHLFSANETYHIESPIWVKRAFVIYDCIDNEEDNFTNLFKINLSSRELVNALYIELSDIYRGLVYQQKSVTCFNMSHKHMDLLKSKCHLTSAVNLCKSHVRDVIDNCSEEFFTLVNSRFMPCDTDVCSGSSNDNVEWNTKHRSTTGRRKSVNDRNEHKCLLYSRLVETRENKQTVTTLPNYDQNEKERSESIFLYMKTNVEGVARSHEKLVKDWPGWSPTVNISWFIAKAYLANFYYTNQRDDVSLTIQTCDDIIDVYRQSFMNEYFAEKTFPVVLSTQWTSIYDKEIQELLGFYSLCSYVFDKCSSRSVYFCVCPVQFALYVKLRTELAHGFSRWIINKYTFDCNEHIRTCLFDHKVKVIGTLTLLKAYSISSKSYR